MNARYSNSLATTEGFAASAPAYFILGAYSAFIRLTIGGFSFIKTLYRQRGHLIPSLSSVDFTIAPHLTHLYRITCPSSDNARTPKPLSREEMHNSNLTLSLSILHHAHQPFSKFRFLGEEALRSLSSPSSLRTFSP